MTQTLALLIDAYRELSARKMFWITLALTGLAAVAIGCCGINERGWTFLWFEIPSHVYRIPNYSKGEYYRELISTIVVPLWFNLAALILAITSTAGLFPDLISSGSIDLYLSKPISRLRLFLTRYFTAMLFAAMQVTLFTGVCFLIVGLRGGSWDVRLWLAVPVVVLVFSFVYCVCALLGVATRSTIASALLAILVWWLCGGLNVAEQTVLMVRTSNEVQEEAFERALREIDQEVEVNSTSATRPETRPLQLKEKRKKLEQQRNNLTASWRSLANAHRIMLNIKTFLPKTGETGLLLTRWLSVPQKSRSEQFDTLEANIGVGFESPADIPVPNPRGMRRATKEIESRSTAWIIGTSLIFEVVIVAWAAWIFCRRDY